MKTALKTWWIDRKTNWLRLSPRARIALVGGVLAAVIVGSLVWHKHREAVPIVLAALLVILLAVPSGREAQAAPEPQEPTTGTPEASPAKSEREPIVDMRQGDNRHVIYGDGPGWWD